MRANAARVVGPLAAVDGVGAGVATRTSLIDPQPGSVSATSSGAFAIGVSDVLDDHAADVDLLSEADSYVVA